MIPPIVLPEELAQIAYERTTGISDPDERYLAMLREIELGRDDQDAELIAACREKAGLL
jgi:hypothetical protein